MTEVLVVGWGGAGHGGGHGACNISLPLQVLARQCVDSQRRLSKWVGRDVQWVKLNPLADGRLSAPSPHAFGLPDLATLHRLVVL